MTAVETGSKMFEDVLENVRKAAEANMKMQHEMLRQWSVLWPGIPTPQTAWLDQMREFQKQWSSTVSELARTHQEVLDKQYQAATESLEEALKFAESKNPDEFRKRSEQLIRKTMDCLKEVSDVQLQEFKDAANKWTELFSKAGK